MLASSEKSVDVAKAVVPPHEKTRPFTPFIIAAGLLTLAFGKALFDLFQFGLKTEIHSHVVLIPFISAYLVWQDWARLPRPKAQFSFLAGVLLLLGIATLGTYFFLSSSGKSFSHTDYLSFTTFSFWLLFVGISVWLLGPSFARAIAFPLIFLVFLVPFPDAMTNTLERASMHASADVYAWMLKLSGAIHFRDGLYFSLPTLTIQVAQECSGIRSSVVLFITSLIAGHMFLQTPWKKALFALFVIPLGLARNAFRIYVISMLSAHWDPNIIHGPLHHRGGPIFFALSLIPFFVLLIYLRKTEPKPAAPKA